MENSPFRQKIQKQHDIVQKQLNKFGSAYEGHTLPLEKIQTYCSLIAYISNLHQAYIYNCMEYFTPAMKQQMLRINKNLIEDLIKKLKYFTSNGKPSAYHYSKGQEKYSSEKKQICQICSSKIRQVDVKIIKQQLASDAYLRRSLLKRIYSDLQNDEQIYSKGQDEVFFQFLNRILINKQEVLSMQTKQINDFLVQVTKSFSDLNFLTEYTPLKITPGDFKQNYKQQLQKTLSQSLKNGFDQKIHSWIERVFEKLKKQIMSKIKNSSMDFSIQTETQHNHYQQNLKKKSQYLASSQNKKEIQILKNENIKFNETINDLQNKLSILQRQRQQTQDYYKKEMQSTMLDKRKMQFQLKKTQKQIFTFRQLKSQEQTLLMSKKKSTRGKTQKTENNENKDELALNQGLNSQGVTFQKKQSKINNSSILNQFKLNQQQNVAKRKKRNALNRLMSKKSQVTKQTMLNIEDKEQLPFEIQKQKETIKNNKKQKQQYINEKSSEQFLKQLQLTKNNSKKHKKKNSKMNFSSKNLGKNSQINSKVEFNLHHEQNDSSKEQNTQKKLTNETVNNNNQSQPQQNNQSKIKKQLEKVSSIVSKSKVKRMISIETKISSLIKTARQSIYKKPMALDNSNIIQETQAQSQNLNSENDIQIMGTTNPGRSNTQGRKNVFQYVPIQNHEQLKDKINQFKQKIELRNTEKLKAIVKNIKINDSLSSKQLGKCYGLSAFNKKNSQSDKQNKKQSQDGQNIAKKQLLYESIDDNKKQISQFNKANQNNKKKDGQLIIQKLVIQQSIFVQTSFKCIMDENSTEKKVNQQEGDCFKNAWLEAMSTMQQEEKIKIFQTLKSQNLIPGSLVFRHYGLLIKRLFSDKDLYNTLFHSQNLNKQKHKNSNIFSSSSKSKQKQSIINIDSKFLDQLNENNQIPKKKTLLNLPKLNQSPPINRLSHIIKKSTFNSQTPRQKNSDQCDVNILTNNPPAFNFVNHPLVKTSTSSCQPVFFSQNDILLLFPSALQAYEYEQNLRNAIKGHNSQNEFNIHKYKLTEEDKGILQSLYLILSQIKNKSKQIYHKIYSFIKYPYQTIRNGFDFINITKDISFEIWARCLFKIFLISYNRSINSSKGGSLSNESIHNSKGVNEKRQQQRQVNMIRQQSHLNFESFIRPFEQKMAQLLIIANK